MRLEESSVKFEKRNLMGRVLRSTDSEKERERSQLFSSSCAALRGQIHTTQVLAHSYSSGCSLAITSAPDVSKRDRGQCAYS